MNYHTSYAFAASPDVVLSVMNDLDLLAGWLAEDLPLTRASDGTLTARFPTDGGDNVWRYRVELGRNPLELSWTPVPEPQGCPGRAVIRALPVGGSVIDVRLGIPVALRTQIADIDRIASHVLRRIDAEAERRQVNGTDSPGCGAVLSNPPTVASRGGNVST